MQVLGAQSLDDIVNQNAKELRRRSLSMSYGRGDAMDSSIRRTSMLEFGGGSPEMEGFQFDPAGAAGLDTSMQDISSHRDSNGRTKRPPPQDLSINTQFQPQAFNSLRSAGSYASPLAVNSSLDVDVNSPYITSSGLPLSMDMNILGNDMAAMDMFGAQNFDSPMIGSPLQHNYTPSMMAPGQDPGGGGGGGGGTMERSMEQAIARSSDNSSATPDYRRKSTSRTNSHEDQGASSRTTTNSTGPSKTTSQMLGIPQTMSNTSYSPQQSSVSGPEMIGGRALPWSKPAGMPRTPLPLPHD